jgi:hypothetical protein
MRPPSGRNRGANCALQRNFRGRKNPILRLNAAAQLAGTHGFVRRTRTVDGGFFGSFAAGRIGRRTSSPPQFAHTKASFCSAHARQYVHSNVQM